MRNGRSRYNQIVFSIACSIPLSIGLGQQSTPFNRQLDDSAQLRDALELARTVEATSEDSATLNSAADRLGIVADGADGVSPLYVSSRLLEARLRSRAKNIQAALDISIELVHETAGTRFWKEAFWGVVSITQEGVKNRDKLDQVDLEAIPRSSKQFSNYVIRAFDTPEIMRSTDEFAIAVDSAIQIALCLKRMGDHVSSEEILDRIVATQSDRLKLAEFIQKYPQLSFDRTCVLGLGEAVRIGNEERTWLWIDRLQQRGVRDNLIAWTLSDAMPESTETTKMLGIGMRLLEDGVQDSPPRLGPTIAFLTGKGGDHVIAAALYEKVMRWYFDASREPHREQNITREKLVSEQKIIWKNYLDEIAHLDPQDSRILRESCEKWLIVK